MCTLTPADFIHSSATHDGAQRQVTRRAQFDLHCITHEAANITFMLMLPIVTLRVVYLFIETYLLHEKLVHISILYHWSRNSCKRHT
jgi:hypothetical protein